MTDEAMNVAVAEACGWRFSPQAAPALKEEAVMCWIQPGAADWQLFRLPSYSTDLNAMHEAESTLQHYGVYCDELSNVMRVGRNSISLIRATARQRAEAFLRTVGKWQEVAT